MDLLLMGGVETPPGVFDPETDATAVIATDPFVEEAPPIWQEGKHMTISITYVVGAELPTTRVLWNDAQNNPIDFSDGWAFLVTVGHIGTPPIFTKSAGLSGGPGYIDVQWDSVPGEDLNQLTAGLYDMQLRARRISDGRDRFCQLQLQMKPTLGMTDS